MPKVSVIVPCYNEEKTILSLLNALYDQTFPRSEMEIVIADGISTDSTRQKISDFKEAHKDLSIKLIDNPKRLIPAALNAAISAAAGIYIVRLDAHSIPRRDYIELTVADLEEGLGQNIGGVWQIKPGAKGWVADSIAAAASHPFGVGDAWYRFRSTPGEVDTVPFGAFRRDLFFEVGEFDESLETNEDYEFNTRIRKSGGVVWLNPDIKATYFARSTFGELARQYWRYGFWKVRMLSRYPETIRWRQALPPIFLSSLIFLWIIAFAWDLAGWILLLEVVLYGLVIFSAGFHMARKKRKVFHLVGVPAAIAVMHLSWGGAFLWSLIRLKPNPTP